MTRYTEAQIIKHALQYYVQRTDACESDLQRERTVLEKYEDRVQWLKEKNKISNKL